MKHWQERSQIQSDVVFFPYMAPEVNAQLKDVFVWDLDKTYLDSKIESLSGLIQTVVEKALQKKNIPGTRSLLLALSEYRRQVLNEELFPIFFITASPPQLEDRISEKFQLDNIQPIGCFYKDNMKNLRPGRFWRLRAQVGFKLQALLQLRQMLPEKVSQICFGDDSETDVVIYNLFSDICSRRISNTEIREILERYSVSTEQADEIFQMQEKIPANDPIERIYINLAIDTDADYYLKFGRRTLATYSTLQIALDLYQNGRLHLVGVDRVMQDLAHNFGFTPEILMRHFEDLIRRGILVEESVEEFRRFFVQKNFLRENYSPSVRPRKSSDVQHEPWIPDRIDYLHDYR